MPDSTTGWLAAACALLLLALVVTLLHYRHLYPLRLRLLSRRLREREERYRRLVQTADVGIVVLDPGFQVLEWSQALERLFGITRDEILGGDFFSYCVFPEDVGRVAAELTAHTADDEVFDAEFPVRTRHEERRVLRWRVRYYTDKASSQRCLTAVGHDVTELRTATFRLMVSEARFRQIFQSAPVAMALAEPDGHLLMVNQEYARFLDCITPEELEGKSLLDATLPEDREVLAQAIRNARRDGGYRLERRFVTRRGETRWAYVRGLMLEDDYGQPYLVSQIADIHERKKAELALTEHRNQLLAAQRIARLGAWQWSAETGKVVLSDVMLEILGHARGDPQPDNARLEALVAEEDRTRLRESIQQLLVDGEHAVVEMRAVTLRGEPRHWRVDATLERDSEGRPWRVLGTTQDVTGAKQAEVALRQSEARYRSLFDTNLDGIFFVSLQGVLEECNPAFLGIVGYSAAEVLQRDSLSLVAAAGQPVVQAAWRQILVDGWCDSFQLDMVQAGSRIVTVAARAWLVRDEQGNPLRVMGMVRDVSDLKRVEAERAQLQKGMQQAQKMEAIGQLAGGIAHDFNNILASILGYTSLALRREAVTGDSRLQRHLQEVQLAGERARELIGQMLLFSRGGRRSGILQSVEKPIQEALGILRPTLPASLRLRTDVSRNLPPIRLDGVGLQQIIMNLVINARDAMGARGEVQLQARLCELEPGHCASCNHPVSGAFVEIAVRDHGPGIPDGVRERMFDPFYTTKPVGQGTGMGLSVVHGTAHEFGGHLLVETGSWGTTFRILFPIPDEVAAEVLPVPEAVRRIGHGERILIVDDELPVADMLGELLETHGYVVEVLTDSRLAAQRLASAADEFDLLLTDLIMPHLDGVELVQVARRHLPGLPVVMLSGQAALLEREAMSWPVLDKPVDVPALLLCIGNMLDSVRMSREAGLA
jgi:PAS domain S-box-containing protein